MQQSLLDITAWLQIHANQPLLIQKEEEGDIDQVEFQLEETTIGSLDQQDPDDYVANQALLLHGTGEVITEGHRSHLPQNVYEIPFDGQWGVDISEGRLMIKTDRGAYIIQPTRT